MLYQKKGDTVLAGSKMFTVGGEVFANHTCDYGGLFGTVTEIRTGPDQCTERDEPDICCDLQPPESETMVMEIKDRFSALFGYPKQLEDLGLDCVILAPSMLEPMPEDLPAEDGRLLSLTPITIRSAVKEEQYRKLEDLADLIAADIAAEE